MKFRILFPQPDVPRSVGYPRPYLGDCQNYGPFLGPCYNTGPNTGPNLGDPKREHNFDNPPLTYKRGTKRTDWEHRWGQAMHTRALNVVRCYPCAH